MRDTRMLIGGEHVAASNGRRFESLNPYTGSAWATIPRATTDDVDAAVAAAAKAFRDPAWRGLTASARGQLLQRFADLVERHAGELAITESTDNGKLIAEMSAQVAYVPQWFRYYGGLADKIEGRVIPIDKPGVLNYTRREPLGVVAAITPWNSPLLLATWKLAPALAAGNTVIWKPSEYSSVSALEFADLFAEAGFPPGVVNVLTGFGGEIGDALVGHPDVAKVAFTGGDQSGQHVYETAASGIKPATLELGGKSAHLVFEDADLDRAVTGVVAGIFAASGQTCIAGSRALVAAPVYDEFLDRLVSFARTARIGDPLDRATQVGPVTTEAQLDKILHHIEGARGEGARCVLGGHRHVESASPDGWFVEPTIFADVEPGMRIAQEEVFGPVLSVLPFESDEEAVSIANDSMYGLAAGVWTRDIAKAVTIPEQLEAGTIWVNMYRAVSYLSPFGGYKRSGVGRESGIESIDQYLQTKSIWVDTNPDVPNPFTLR